MDNDMLFIAEYNDRDICYQRYGMIPRPLRSFCLLHFVSHIEETDVSNQQVFHDKSDVFKNQSQHSAPTHLPLAGFQNPPHPPMTGF